MRAHELFIAFTVSAALAVTMVADRKGGMYIDTLAQGFQAGEWKP